MGRQSQTDSPQSSSNEEKLAPRQEKETTVKSNLEAAAAVVVAASEAAAALESGKGGHCICVVNKPCMFASDSFKMSSAVLPAMKRPRHSHSHSHAAAFTA